MSTRRIIREANEAGATLDAVLRDLPAVLEDLEDGWSGIRAQHYDPSTGSGALWCEDHERELARCEALELGCIGVTDQHQRGDSTGEAAIGGDPDRARYTEITDAVERLVRQVAFLDRLVSAASPQERNAAAAAIAARQASAANAKPTGCECCARVENHVPISTTGTVDGRLDRPHALCQACRDFVRERGRVPTVEESDHHRRHGKGWPKMTQRERLQLGLVAGALPP